VKRLTEGLHALIRRSLTDQSISNISRQQCFAAFLLAILTLGAFGRVSGNDFINYDDRAYVVRNPGVQGGLGFQELWWALTTTSCANWHPLTWISFQLDHALFGLHAWGYHVTNLVLHVANVLLLFLVLCRMTRATWPSALVAGLFAVHPLHVESVAWVAERKDVLSTLFWMLTLVAYVRYCERPLPARYMVLVLCFSAGLAAKSMLVTLPFVLLLLDYWPQRRLSDSVAWGEMLAVRAPHPDPPPQGRREKKRGRGIRFGSLLLEKAPLFVLSIASSAITLYAQKVDPGTATTAVSGAGIEADWLARAGYVAVSYVRYIGWSLWPRDLIPFHAYPRQPLPGWEAVGATLLLVAVSVAVIKARRRAPYLMVGWFWYLGTLVPVIGIVRVQGGHGMADRYTYVPAIGLFIMAAWGSAELAARWRLSRAVNALVVAGVAALLLAATWIQVGYWHDSKTLWHHTLDVDPENYLAHHDLGVVLARENAWDEAIKHFQQAARIDPSRDLPHVSLGDALAHQGKMDQAIDEYREGLRLNPNRADSHNLLGMALETRGNLRGAQEEYSEALLYNPALAEAHANLGMVLTRLGKFDDAEQHFRAAIQIEPQMASARHGLGLMQAVRGNLQEAVKSYGRAIDLQPRVSQYHRDLAHALAMRGQTDAARSTYQRSLRLAPDWPQAADREAWRLATDPSPENRNGPLAVHLAAEVCEVTGYAKASYLDTLAAACAEAGRFDEAQTIAAKALGLPSSGESAEWRKSVEERLRLYKANRPFRETSGK
jgi:tetratricopeptide (TPR) repeat protein